MLLIQQVKWLVKREIEVLFASPSQDYVVSAIRLISYQVAPELVVQEMGCHVSRQEVEQDPFVGAL